jgi:hypothetical protein
VICGSMASLSERPAAEGLRLPGPGVKRQCFGEKLQSEQSVNTRRVPVVRDYLTSIH